MGQINHNAVVATTCFRERAGNLVKWIRSLSEEDRSRFAIGPVLMNGYQTIILVPDGSKEGWPDSDDGDKLRQLFINRIGLDSYDDGSSSWNWVEIGFGEYGQKILHGNNSNRYSNTEYFIM